MAEDQQGQEQTVQGRDCLLRWLSADLGHRAGLLVGLPHLVAVGGARGCPCPVRARWGSEQGEASLLHLALSLHTFCSYSGEPLPWPGLSSSLAAVGVTAQSCREGACEDQLWGGGGGAEVPSLEDTALGEESGSCPGWAHKAPGGLGTEPAAVQPEVSDGIRAAKAENRGTAP